MRHTVLFALLLGGCASAPAEAPAPGPRRAVLSTTESGQYVELPSLTRAVVTEIDLGAGQGWPRLIQLYGALGLPVATVQSAEMRVGNPNFTIRHQIAGLRATRVFECGRGRGGIPVAELYPIQVSLHTRLIAIESGGTRVESILTGIARDASGNSTNPVSCGSTGALERTIAERLAESGTG